MLIQPVWAQDGKLLYTQKFCITCHGKEGIAIAPNYPNLAGQNPEYIKNQVKDLKTGKRKSRLSILMTLNPIVMKTTDEEIAAIADYISKQK
ncbi:MAG: cytochrome c [SAR324 cluster bacterium]|nr:cytochrome c [SAR324 cluster bacterium]